MLDRPAQLPHERDRIADQSAEQKPELTFEDPADKGTDQSNESGNRELSRFHADEPKQHEKETVV